MLPGVHPEMVVTVYAYWFTIEDQCNQVLENGGKGQRRGGPTCAHTNRRIPHEN
jgi:hypothetical protein